MSNEQLQRLPFSHVFESTKDEGLRLKHCVVIDGLEFNVGKEVRKGVTLGGIDFSLVRGADIAALIHADGCIEFKGVYRTVRTSRHNQNGTSNHNDCPGGMMPAAA